MKSFKATYSEQLKSMLHQSRFTREQMIEKLTNNGMDRASAEEMVSSRKQLFPHKNFTQEKDGRIRFEVSW